MQAILNKLTNPMRSFAAGTWVALVSVLSMCFCATAANAQKNIVVTGPATQIGVLGGTFGGGWDGSQSPLGGTFVVGANGNVIIGGGYGGNITQITPSGVQSILVSGLDSATAAMDSYGNVYVAPDGYNPNIYKLPYNAATGAYAGFTTAPTANCLGGAQDTAACIFAPNLANISGSANYGFADIAFDSQGNFFVATDTLPKPANTIYECNAACQTDTTGTKMPVLLYTDSTNMGALAIDPWGNLFFIDGANNGAATGKVSNLKELPLQSGRYAASPTVLESYTTVGGYNGLSGLAVAGNGTVYFATNADGIFAMPNTQASGPATAGIYMVSTQGGKAIALDSKGNIYFIPYNNGDVVSLILVNNVPLAATTIGGAATTATVTVIDSAAACTPTLTLAASEGGVATTEFSAKAGSSCSAALGTGNGSFSPAVSLTGAAIPATITFAPAAVGERNAALTITDAANSASGTTIVSGVGQGVLANLDPGVTTAYATGLTSPASVIADAAGDVFVADSGAGKVFKIAAGATTPSAVGSGFITPDGLAFDAGGNLYVSDASVAAIFEITNTGTTGAFVAGTQSTIISSTALVGGAALSAPMGLAVGPDGTLYIADNGNARVITYNTVNGQTGVTVANAANGLKSPAGVAVDSSSNLYVADNSANEVFIVSGGVISTLAPSSVKEANGVAVDASGSVLIADKASGKIVRVPDLSGTLTASQAVTVETVPTQATSLAMDAWGDLYVADASNKTAYAIQRTAASVNIGAVQDLAFGTATVYLMDAGNETATVASPAVTEPTNTMFTLTPAATNGCTSGASGPTGAICQFVATFTPAAGITIAETGTATVNTNAIDSPSTVTMTGTGTKSSILPQTITGFSPPAIAYIGQQITLSATGGQSGNPVVFSIDANSSCLTCATVNGNTLTASAAGAILVDANQAGGVAGGQTYGAAPQVQMPMTIKSATPAGVPGMVMNQQTWLPALSGGGAFAQDTASGSTFGVNANGDVLLSDSYGGSVLEYTPSTGKFTTLGSYGKYSNTGAVTLDSAGNLYVSALYSGIVVKVPYANGVYAALTDATSGTQPGNCTGSDTAECVVAPVSNVSGIGGISAMTFDSSGNFFLVTDDQGTPWSIWECTAACMSSGTPAPALIFKEPAGNNSSTTVGQLYVGSLAVDPWGNLFFTDSYLIDQSANKSQSNYSDLYELPYTSGTGFAAKPVLLQTFTNTTPGGYDNEIDGVAVTSNGTVYYASQYDGIFAIPNTKTGGPVIAGQYAISGQGAKEIALDANGNIYYVSYHGSGDTLGQILTGNNLTVPTAQLDGAPTSATATVVENAAGCSSRATLTISSSNAEFAATAGATCSSIGFGDGTLAVPLATAAISSYPATITFSATSGGPQTATLSLVDTANGGIGTATVNGIGQETPQIITFTKPTTTTFTYGVAPITLAATGGGSNLPISFSIDSGSTATGSITGNTLTVTGAGTLVIDANQAGGLVGGIYYSAATQAQLTLTINPEAQTITFPAPASPLTFVNGLTATLSATSTSGGTVVFSLDAKSTGAGTIAGNVLTVTTVGNLIIDANVPASTDYAAPTQVQQTIVVNQGTQAIVFAPPTSPVNFLTGLTISLAATGGGSGNPVTFTLDPNSSATGTVSATTLTGGISTATVTVTSQGTLVIDANQAASTNFLAATQVQQSVKVLPPLPTQTITFNNPGTQVVGTPVTLTATASSGLPVSFSTLTTSVCTLSGTYGATAKLIAAGTCTVTASQGGSSAWAAAPLVSQSFIVNPTGVLPNISFNFSLSSLSVQPGTVGLTQLTVNSLNSFTGTVSFACSGLPSGAFCTFTPNPVTVLAAQSATTTLSVSTSAKTAAVRRDSRPLFPVATLAVALCFLGFRKRSRLQLLLLLVIGIAGLGVLSGCGGNSGSTAVAPTSTTVTVTATAGNITQSSTFTLIVE